MKPAYLKMITNNKIIASFLLLLLLPFFAYSTEKKAVVNVKIGSINGINIVLRTKVKPFYSFKFKNIVKQKLDFSCGSASVATLLNYFLNYPISEEKVVNDLFKVGNVKKIIERKGFSLLDIKRYFGYLGYKAVGYKTDVKGLVSFKKPAIVTIVIGKYKHFVIFKGVYKGRVFLADPALGSMILPIEEFEKMWYKNIALVVEPNKNIGDRLKIRKDEMLWVNSSKIREAVFYSTLPIFKSPSEF